MNNEILEELRKTNRLLSALLTISVDRHLRDTDLAKPRPRSIDRMLAELGLTGVEIAKLLGKTPQAVSQALTAEGKPKAKKNEVEVKKGDNNGEVKE